MFTTAEKAEENAARNRVTVADARRSEQQIAMQEIAIIEETVQRATELGTAFRSKLIELNLAGNMPGFTKSFENFVADVECSVSSLESDADHFLEGLRELAG